MLLIGCRCCLRQYSCQIERANLQAALDYIFFYLFFCLFVFFFFFFFVFCFLFFGGGGVFCFVLFFICLVGWGFFWGGEGGVGEGGGQAQLLRDGNKVEGFSLAVQGLVLILIRPPGNDNGEVATGRGWVTYNPFGNNVLPLAF